MITLISSLVIFLLVVMLHEFGHFTVAKLSGIKVNKGTNKNQTIKSI